jgi:hypothetical protein
MPGYIRKALQRFAIPPTTRAQHAPHAWAKPVYGQQQQLTKLVANSPALDAADRQRLQEIIGTLLYYGRPIDSTLLVAIGTLASAQTQGTKATANASKQLLNYCATHPNAIVGFPASNMCLHINSDASYLSEPKAHSDVGGIFYLSDLPSTKPTPNEPNAPLNSAIHTVSNILRNVMSSAAEAKFGGLFYNGQEACPIRQALINIGHPQPATPMKTDNSTACSIANDTVKQHCSKAMDMRFYWIRCRSKQNQFRIHRKPGQSNHADYFTKHHTASHHHAMCPRYLHVPIATE